MKTNPRVESGAARFLVPLADVMVLLFSLFLLMPHMGPDRGLHSGDRDTFQSEWGPEDWQRLRWEWQGLRYRDRLQAGQKYLFLGLSIDATTGTLLVYEGQKAIEINEELLRRYQEAASQAGRPLLCVLHVPRPGPHGEISVRPLVEDERRYRALFNKLGIDYVIDYPWTPSDALPDAADSRQHR
ncbi:MAG: hypothetical protein C4297_02905 [Gemmataceae bacterium]